MAPTSPSTTPRATRPRRKPAQTAGQRAHQAALRRTNLMRLQAAYLRDLGLHDRGTAQGGEGEFARLIGLPVSYLSRIKAGGRNIGDKLATKIEARCGMPAGWLSHPGTSIPVPEKQDCEALLEGLHAMRSLLERGQRFGLVLSAPTSTCTALQQANGDTPHPTLPLLRPSSGNDLVIRPTEQALRDARTPAPTEASGEA